MNKNCPDRDAHAGHSWTSGKDNYWCPGFIIPTQKTKK